MEKINTNKLRVASSNITELKDNEIFVFGSNLAGIHGAGAAKTALQWGAEMGKGIGVYGQTFALPTKDHTVDTLPLHSIATYITAFMVVAQTNPDYNFLVTEVGCGLAGYKVKDVAPLFLDLVDVSNVYLPQSFWDHYKGIHQEHRALIERDGKSIKVTIKLVTYTDGFITSIEDDVPPRCLQLATKEATNKRSIWKKKQ